MGVEIEGFVNGWIAGDWLALAHSKLEHVTPMPAPADAAVLVGDNLESAAA